MFNNAHFDELCLAMCKINLCFIMKHLALFTPASPVILQKVVSRYREYIDTTSLRVCTGTWNVNGGKHFRSIAFKHQSMNDWLLDAPKILAETKPGRNHNASDELSVWSGHWIDVTNFVCFPFAAC